MCDCYTAKCAKCGRDIPMHLGDFETKRDEIEVYCIRCFSDELKGTRSVIWFNNKLEQLQECFSNAEWKRVWDATIGEEDYVIVKSLTDNAWEHKFENHPNYACGIPIPVKALGMFLYGFEMYNRGVCAADW